MQKKGDSSKYNFLSKTVAFVGLTEVERIDCLLDKDAVVALANDIAGKDELTALTLENNRVTDIEGFCKLLTNLKTFERIEKLEFRQNGFTPQMSTAIKDGIMHKNELRVSFIVKYSF